MEKACEKGINYFTDRRPMDFSRNQEEIPEDDIGGTGKLGNAGHHRVPKLHPLELGCSSSSNRIYNMI